MILESDGSPQGIMDQKMKTLPAFRWAKVINSGYLSFWDAASPNDEFVITDVGMTSENEKGWNEITTYNICKINFLKALHETILKMQEKDNKDDEKEVLNQLLQQVETQLQFVANFHENFQMFPISANRMIVLISPYFKFIDSLPNLPFIPPYPDLNDLTMLANKRLFKPNDAKYVKPYNGFQPDYHDDDKYIYEIKKLNRDEIRYCNSLFLDRVDTTLGFSSLSKALGSIWHYKKLTKHPTIPRVDYKELYNIIIERYGNK